MAEIIMLDRADQTDFTRMTVAAVDEAAQPLSKGTFTFLRTTYSDTTLKTMLVGGIGTPVHLRRGGNVRKMMEFMHQKAAEEEVAVSLLHPFSFSYYRMFGYEKVSDHLILRFPTRMIGFVPRRCNFVPYDESMLSDVTAVYKAFSAGRNLLLPRNSSGQYEREGRSTYVLYENGTPCAYIIWSAAKKMIVNHMGDGVLTVHELAYTTPSALREIFSFLRMFEGELDDIEFANCAMCPEVEMLLRHYTHTSYRLVPDVMARVINTEILLSAKTYPAREGEFTVRVEDTLPTAAGVYKVSFGGGDSRVSRLSDAEEADLTLTAGAFSRLVYGYDGADSRSAAYMDGVSVHRCCEDFFRAFQKMPCGTFEHF